MSAFNGSSFDVVVEVCNQGTAASDPADVSLFLSSDGVIEGSGTGSDPDPFLGGAAVLALAPGECHSQTVQVWANVPSEGAWHLGAFADEFNVVKEKNSANNTLAGHLIGVGSASDLVVVGIDTPPSVPNGSSFDAQVEVCNQGTQPSGFADVSLYLSSDDQIEGWAQGPSPDPFLGTFPLPSMQPGQCRVETGGPFYVSVPDDGAWTTGAIVDESDSEPELIESNNSFSGGLLGVGSGPDLVITAVGGPHSVRNGEALLADVEVCNQGTTPSGPAEVTFYLSSDDVIEGSMQAQGDDPFLGSLPLPGISPGECFPAEASLQANVPEEGAYHLGGIADELDGQLELIESNNTFVGALIGVGSGSDLVVASLSGPPSVEQGTMFEPHVEVCNHGTQPSAATDVTLYLTRNDHIEPPGLPGGGDVFLAGAPVPALPEGQCYGQAVSAWASVPDEGEWMLGALVDEFDSETELIESNNEHLGGSIGVGSGADLVVASLSGPPSVENGASFDTLVEVCNFGTQPSAPSDVSLYFSSDAELDGMLPFPGDDHPVGGTTLQALAPGECVDATAPGWASVPTDGAWYLGAIVDEFDGQAELIESNNSLVGDLTGVGFGPDLVIVRAEGPPSTQNSASFDAEVEVCNQGTQPSGPTGVSLYLSKDAKIDGSAPFPPGGDTPLGNFPVPGLAPGQCDAPSGPVWPNVPEEGAFYLGAIVDEFDSELELVESNNVFTGSLIGVGLGPDLIVTQVVAPPSAQNGETLDAQVEVCNQGTQPSGPTDVTLYLSSDDQIDPWSSSPPGQDPPLGNLPVAPLSPGECRVETGLVYVFAPSDGAWQLGALVDEADTQQELIESNNSFVEGPIGVGYGPDLVILSLTGPSNFENGMTFDASFEVCNQGTAISAASDLTLYLSRDALIEGSFPIPGADFFLDARPVPPLAPGLCHADVASVQAAVPEYGSWFVGGFVDEFDGQLELIESNNTLAEHVIEIVPPGS